MQYNLDFTIASICFLLLLMYLSRSMVRLSKDLFSVYTTYTKICLLDLAFEVVTTITVTDMSLVPLWANRLMNALYLASIFWIPTLYLMYAVTLTELKVSLWIKALFFVPSSFGTVFALLSIRTGWLFTIDEGGYRTGPMHWLLYASAIFYIALALIVLLMMSERLEKRNFIVSVLLVCFSFLPSLGQIVWPDILLNGMGMTIALYFMFFATIPPKVSFDAITGAMSMDAFFFHNKESMEQHAGEKILVFVPDDIVLVSEVSGVSGENAMLRNLAGRLQEEFSMRSVYRCSDSAFAVTNPSGVDDQEIIKKAEAIASEPFGQGIFQMKGTVSLALIKTGCFTFETLSRAIEYSLDEAKRRGRGSRMALSEATARKFDRESMIDRALLEAVGDGGLEVHYQPIYSLKDKKYISMEALSRLSIDAYGPVSPEEFIPLAEKNGTISEIGLLVLDDACRFIKQSDDLGLGIECIEVNLSMEQCFSESLYGDVMEVMGKNEVDPRRINFEITESIAAASFQVLRETMEKLKAEGFSFSLDDYGTGYSNFSNIVSLPFDIVKIDKSLVKKGMDVEVDVAEKLSSVFKALGLGIVAEGIEDEDTEKRMGEIGVDYIQGFYHSRPLSNVDAVKFLHDNNGLSNL